MQNDQNGKIEIQTKCCDILKISAPSLAAEFICSQLFILCRIDWAYILLKLCLHDEQDTKSFEENNIDYSLYP